jgi:hypothetical protein
LFSVTGLSPAQHLQVGADLVLAEEFPGSPVTVNRYHRISVAGFPSKAHSLRGSRNLRQSRQRSQCLQKDDESLPILLGKIKSEGMARNRVGFLVTWLSLSPGCLVNLS